ncbi:MAG: hypothetical protein MRY78_19240 [Saprospiraceae bacterium]|nr:hypothetical protein [Saprospiraceae bacterium]
MKFKQILGAILLIGALTYFGIKFQSTLEMLSDNALSFLMLMLVVILLLFGFRKILSDF